VGGVCTDPHCTAEHPSRGGKAGKRCVETGKAIVAPMDTVTATEVVSKVLGGISWIVGVVASEQVSGPTDREVTALAPVASRVVWRYFGAFGGHFDLVILFSLLSGYVIARGREASAKKAAPAKKAAAAIPATATAEPATAPRRPLELVSAPP
jgi:hypothetical protein